jgi:hypothetical protein
MEIFKERPADSPLERRSVSLAYARRVIGYTARGEFEKFAFSSTSGIYPSGHSCVTMRAFSLSLPQAS